MSKLTIEDLKSASDTVLELAEGCGGFHPEHPLADMAAAMRMHLSMTRLYLMDYAKGLSQGEDPEEALLKTISGERALSAEAVKNWEERERLRRN